MKYKIIISAIIISFLFVTCKTNGSKSENKEKSKNMTVSKKEIPFNVANNYYVKNNIDKDFMTLTIFTQEDFDKYFGMAATMGENGKPTTINFSEEYVIAIIGEESDFTTVITPESLFQNGNAIDFTYVIREEKKETYKSRTPLILIVNKEYKGDINFIQK